MPSGFGTGAPHATIFTPVDLRVERVIQGNIRSGAMRIVIEGGKAGCYTMNVDVTPRLSLGQRFVLFLYPSWDSNGTPNPGLLMLRRDAWGIDAQDVVQTVGGPMPLEQLIQRIDRVTASPTP
jgi:hypothetical protein